MGKGQLVSVWYMGIREGAPCPIMVMKVGVGSWMRVSGEIDLLRERMYSWQYCRLLVPGEK